MGMRGRGQRSWVVLRLCATTAAAGSVIRAHTVMRVLQSLNHRVIESSGKVSHLCVPQRDDSS